MQKNAKNDEAKAYKNDIITLAHGAGGRVMQELISNRILGQFTDAALEKLNIEVSLADLDDSAVVNDIVFTTDSHTVKPLFFPGGDIGSLSVAGTINDIAVMGVKPLALSCAFVLEEGLPVEDLDRIIASIGATSKAAGVPIVTGDTKVVERGSVENMFVNTSGIGKRTEQLDRNIQIVKEYREFSGRWLKDSNLRPGDKIILTGSIGDHGIALLSYREGYGFETELQSDVKPLNHLLREAVAVGGIVAMKDPTRGGLANTLNEWSEKSKMGIIIDEETIPIKPPVHAACEMLGIDPLNIGNEGKAVIGVVPELAEEVLKTLRKHPDGVDAAIIGEVKYLDEIKGVVLETLMGGKRIVDAPAGDPVPRIC
ncbi:hydrogenase expression/formation protein HypE [[Eubacterium] cellulosolvens]